MWKLFAVNPIPTIDTKNIPKPGASTARLDDIVGLIFSVLGTIAVLMIVIGGIRYIASRGNPGEMTKAKDTILYSVIGLGVVIMSYAIAAFVVSNL